MMPDAVVEVSVDDEGVVENVDTPEDYRKALQRSRPGSES
jgi:CTP:molybdopterin cytidylyltransferase MocA